MVKTKSNEIFTKKYLERYADVLIWGLETARGSVGGKYKKGDTISVSYEWEGVKLAECLYRKLLQRGFHVVMRARSTPEMERAFFQVASDDQLKFLPPWGKKFNENINGAISIIAPSSLTHLSDIDSRKIALSAISSKPLREVIDKREQDGKHGWTLCVMPTEALAKQAKMSVKEYGKEIIRACHLDKDNPVKIWKDLYKESQEIKKRLNSLDVDYFHIKSAETDLKVYLGKNRKWLGVSGHNVPSFEIFTSPDWRGAEGIYYANMPSLKDGNYTEGIRLEFKNGEVVKVSAKKGAEFVKKQVKMDKGSKRIGELSFTDKRFSPISRFMAETLFDENVGGKYGNCHIALGRSYADTYNGNIKKLNKKLKESLGFNDSSLHWDIINTENKVVTAHLKNGEKKVIYSDGMFKI